MQKSSSDFETLVGIPEKGRNAGIALEEELDSEAGELLDLINGEGKKAAKTGYRRQDIYSQVRSMESLEIKDTGRKFPRPVLNYITLEETEIKGFSRNPLNSDFDRFYQGIDLLIEQNYSYEGINDNLVDLARNVAEENGYTLEERLGDEVQWGPMNTDLDEVPEKVLIPGEFENLGKSIAEYFWNKSLEFEYFNAYENTLDGSYEEEEELISETSQDVAAVYMFVTGNTAGKYNLEYTGLKSSYLGLFEPLKSRNSKPSS